ncbi:MAG TPA: DUF502 domain-containing protein [Opitutaceae bacterium]|nr:DUF502 domain-containing protein [Opitutaceae bacterium]
MSAPVSRLTSLRNAFLTGLVLLAPLAVTWMVFSWLVESVGGRFRPYFFFFLPENLRDNPSLELIWNLLATVVVVVVVTLLGTISRYVLGRFFGQLTERAVQSIPGVSSVYNTVKQIVGTFSSQNRNVFSKVVLVEFPREGAWAVGFLTDRVRGEPQAKLPSDLWSVFVPTTPNPTGGFLIMVPRGKIIELEMSVGDGMKLVISGGVVVPPWTPSTVMPADLPRPTSSPSLVS